MDLDLVVVYRARNELMANSVRDLLAQEDIPAMLNHFRGIANSLEHNRTNIYGNNFGAWGEVLVDRPRADQAFELIQGFLAASDAPLSEEELAALALAGGSSEESGLASESVETDPRSEPIRLSRAWLSRTWRALWILFAGPPENHWR